MVAGRLVGKRTRAVGLIDSSECSARLRGVFAGVGSVPGAMDARKRRPDVGRGWSESDSKAVVVEKRVRRVECGVRCFGDGRVGEDGGDSVRLAARATGFLDEAAGVTSRLVRGVRAPSVCSRWSPRCAATLVERRGEKGSQLSPCRGAGGVCTRRGGDGVRFMAE